MHTASHTFIALVTLAATVSGQDLVRVYEGLGHSQRFGAAVAGVGDVDADGYDDAAVASQHEGDGTLRIYSGRDGSVLHLFTGDPDHYLSFASTVDGAGDVNADGHADVVVGIPDYAQAYPNWLGMTRVYSGLDGSLIHETVGNKQGHHVAGAGDVNDDGFDDYLTSSDRDDRVLLYSGATGQVLHIFGLYGVGDSVAGIGDVNADGHDDIVLGTHWWPNDGVHQGAVFAFSGADYSELWCHLAEVEVAGLGTSLAPAGDVDGDGIVDVIAAAPGGGFHGAPGHAVVLSGQTGETLHVLYVGPHDPANYDYRLTVAGGVDLNQDGTSDLVVGGLNSIFIPQPRPGAVRVYDGVDGSVLWEVTGSTGEELGYDVAVGDFGGNGVLQILVGAPGADPPSGTNAGRAFLYVPAGSIDRYCSPAQANSSGAAARIDVTGSTLLVLENLKMRASDLPPGQFGYFLVGDTQGLFMPPGSQGFACVTGAVGRYDDVQEVVTGPAGAITVDLRALPLFPTRAVQTGETWNFQCWYRDAPATSNFTDAVAVRFL